MKPITKAAGNTCLIAGLALTILPFMASPVGAQSPTLGITNDPVSGVSVFWPVADAAYSLQWTPALEPPIVWQPFPFSPALSADANNLVVNLASLQATNPQAFFQLVSNPVVVPAAPSVVTGGVYPLNTFYFLEGSVQPNALDTTYWFQWGQTTTPYPEITSSGVVGGSNTAPVGVEIEIDGLAAGTLYHYQIYGS